MRRTLVIPLQRLVINLLKDNLFLGNEPVTNLSDEIAHQLLKYMVISLCVTSVSAMIPYLLLKPQKEKKKKTQIYLTFFLRSLVFFYYGYSFKIFFLNLFFYA